MGLTSTVTGKYENGYVRVEIGSRNREHKYYKLPEANVDAFEREYKKNSSKLGWASTGIMLGAIIAAITPAALLSKKIEKKALRHVANICPAVLAGLASVALSNRIEANSHTKLLQKYGAEEIR